MILGVPVLKHIKVYMMQSLSHKPKIKRNCGLIGFKIHYKLFEPEKKNLFERINQQILYHVLMNIKC